MKLPKSLAKVFLNRNVGIVIVAVIILLYYVSVFRILTLIERAQQQQEGLSRTIHQPQSRLKTARQTRYPNNTLLQASSIFKYHPVLSTLQLPSRQSIQAAPSICCFVNTYEPNHARARVIRETWGKHCDHLVFLSNVTDPSLPSFALKAPATHDKLWQKHQESLLFVHQHYGNSYDYFLKVDDDTFVMLDNLKHYLLSRAITKFNTSTPLMLGHRMTLPKRAMQVIKKEAEKYAPVSPAFLAVYEAYEREYPEINLHHYTPGGAGYVVNAAYLHASATLIQHGCFAHDVIPDDVALSLCMETQLGIKPIDTRDEYDRERFHQYDPRMQYYKPVLKSEAGNEFTLANHIGIGAKNGVDCCAPSSISFHYIQEPEEMRAMYRAFYNGTSHALSSQ